MLPSTTHAVSEELQELLSLQSIATDVVVRRKISKSIWRLPRKERRKRAAAMIVSAAEAKRAPGPLLSRCSNHLNWYKVFGVQAAIADKVISDFFAEIFELKDEALMTENAIRAAHVENWRCLDHLSKEACKLVISRDLLDLAIKKLKRGKSSPDGCVAEVYHALPPSATDVLRNGLQGMLDTLSFPTEWTEISAVLIPKCVGPQGLKDYRPLASLCAIRKLLGYVWMLSLPRELPWRSFQAAFLPGRDAAQAVFSGATLLRVIKRVGSTALRCPIGPQKKHSTRRSTRPSAMRCCPRGYHRITWLNGVLMRAGEHDVLWERTLTFVGCELESSGHSGAALAHRIVKANGVFSAWRPILLNPNIPLRARAEAFGGISVASSLLWQAGNWTLTESELSRLGSWGARKLFAMSCKRRNPNHSVGEHWKQLHRVGMKWRRAFR